MHFSYSDIPFLPVVLMLYSQFSPIQLPNRLQLESWKNFRSVGYHILKKFYISSFENIYCFIDLLFWDSWIYIRSLEHLFLSLIKMGVSCSKKLKFLLLL